MPDGSDTRSCNFALQSYVKESDYARKKLTHEKIIRQRLAQFTKVNYICIVKQKEY